LGGQQWRELLNSNEQTSHQAGDLDRTQRRKTDMLSILASACEIKDLAAFLSNPVTCYGQSFSPASTTAARQVIWELFELGFRAELYQLDQYLRRSTLPGSAGNGVSLDSEAVRDQQIVAVFADGQSLQFGSLPSAPSGLAAVEPRERAKSLIAQLSILREWPSASPELNDRRTVNIEHDPAAVLELESVVIKFYANQFFQAAGRPPCIPHRFPAT